MTDRALTSTNLEVFIDISRRRHYYGMPLKLDQVDLSAIEYRCGTIACAVVYPDAD